MKASDPIRQSARLFQAPASSCSGVRAPGGFVACLKSYQIDSPVLRGFILVGLILLVYLPSYRAGFIWDDDVMAANELVKGGWRGLYDIWFSTKFADFVPLTSTSFWIEWQLWGSEQSTQHATNVVLHALNALLVWRVLRLLAVPGAWWAALLFCLHPVCVASVTWIAERKNTLSMVFYLASLLFYLRWDEQQQGNNSSQPHASGAPYVFSLICFVLGLLSKSSVVVLPVVFWLFAWWRRGRVTKREVLWCIPFLAAGFLAGLMTLAIHHGSEVGKGVELADESLLVRSLGGSWAIWFYLQKLVLPVNLTMHYPRWEVDSAELVSYLPGILIIAALIVFWNYRQSWGRPWLFASCYFIVALSPTLGIINMAYLTYSRVADHFQYLALPGMIALFVAGLSHVLHRFLPHSFGGPKHNGSITVAALAPVCLLAALSWHHQQLVGSADALWRDNLRINPRSWPAHNNLGQLMGESGNFKEAEEHFRAAIIIKPNSAESYYNLGTALFRAGDAADAQEALGALFEATRLNPNDAKAQSNLGAALLGQGRTNEALLCFRKAIRHDARNPEARYNLARTLSGLGQNREAISQFRIALQIQPGNWRLHNDLGRVLMDDGHVQEGIAHFSTAAHINPLAPEVHANLGASLYRNGQFSESLLSWKEAFRLAPKDASFCAALADVCTKAGKPEQAADYYRIALELAKSDNELRRNDSSAMLRLLKELKTNPQTPEILNNLAWIAATSQDAKCRDACQAVEWAQKACVLAGSNCYFLDTAAAAYAEAGRFQDAIDSEQKAIELALKVNDAARVETFRERLKLYRAGKPFRDAH